MKIPTSFLLWLLPGALLLPAQTPPPSSGQLAAAIQPFVDDQTLAGAVMLVASKDEIVDLEAVGYADLAAKKPMAVDDEFWIASMSKAMTAAALTMGKRPPTSLFPRSRLPGCDLTSRKPVPPPRARAWPSSECLIVEKALLKESARWNSITKKVAS